MHSVFRPSVSWQKILSEVSKRQLWSREASIPLTADWVTSYLEPGGGVSLRSHSSLHVKDCLDHNSILIGCILARLFFLLFTGKTFVQNSFTAKSFQVVLRQKLTAAGFHSNRTEGIKGRVRGSKDTSEQWTLVKKLSERFVNSSA